MSPDQNATLVFIPFPVLSHQAAAVQLAELLVSRDPRLSVAIILMKLPIDTKTGSSPEKTSPDSRIHFVHLPPDESGFATSTESPKLLVDRFVTSQQGPVRDAVSKLIETGSQTKPSRLAGFVVDMFCTAMVDVAHELGVPSYVFFTCSASCLGLLLHLQGLVDFENRDLKEYKDSDEAASISVPTYGSPVPVRVWPEMVFDGESIFLNFARKFRETKGIIVNTFLELEPRAVRALVNLPPVYPVGPIIQYSNEDNKELDEITKWLDEKPDSSVVFLCFGSRGSFDADQVREIAAALERIGCGFLWSLRKPAPKGKFEFPGEFENVGEFLPDGFLERISGFGKVIGWAPQVAVLAHRAVGGFVSHCGWNSTLESVWCGVPMAVWPLAAEQQANAFQLVTELGIAVEIKMDYKRDSGVIVPADRIERAVGELMGTENEGRRAKVRALSETSRAVMSEGGSSYEFLGRFIDDVLENGA
ncbi:UDP-sugar:glycosyltransferase [Striga asiatica]|uniref:Glycosyltransferase n=1 Tax=Striga asiatica TaxID=4170 RepID=A0A5A7RBJ1_STRAF|nr:UDP-sugar:glycosyltransferase [Striga asiatica]